MAETVGQGPAPLDTKSDYDGRSLLEVVQVEGLRRPMTWPPTDDPVPVVEVKTEPAISLDEADCALLPLGVTIAGHDNGIYQTTWQANALGFADFTVYEYWLDTAAALVLQPYFKWRRDLDRSPNVPRTQWLLTTAKEASEAGLVWSLDQAYPVSFPGKPLNPSETLGLQTIRAAHNLMAKNPERFCDATGYPQAIFGRHPNAMLLAICVVRCFWNRRIKEGDKFTIFRKRASRTHVVRPLETISDELAQKAQAIPSNGTEAVPGVPTLEPTEDKSSPSKETITKNLTEAIRTLQACEKKAQQAKNTGQGSFENDALHFATLAAHANLLENMDDAASLDWPVLSSADEDELLRCCEQVRGPFQIGPNTTIEDFPPELINHRLSSIFNAQAQALRTDVGEDKEAKFDLLKRHEDIQKEAAEEVQTAEVQALERKKLEAMLQQTATGGAINPDLVSVKDAAAFLNLDWNNAIINIKNPHLKYKPHQLSAICTIIDALNSPKKFIFLAMACGVGKTVIYVASILYRLRQMEREAEETGERPFYRPHIVFTLSQLAPATFSQVTEFFAGDLDLYLVYGDSRSEKNTFKKKKMLSTPEFKQHTKSLSSKDPKTGRVVYVTSYQTFLARFCTAHEEVSWAMLPQYYKQQWDLMEQPADEKKSGYSFVSIDEEIKLDFETVVCDEAHVLKNELARVHQTIAAVPTQVRIFASATPMLNHPGDLYAYLLLAFRHIPMPELPDDFPVEALYDVENFNAFGVIGEQGYKDAWGTDREPDPVLGPCHPGRKDAAADMLREAFNEGDQRLWMYSHELFRRAADQKRWVYDHCVKVIKPIITTLLLRHDMTTTTELPDGTFVTPGDDIKASECHTSVLFLQGHGLGLYKKWETRLQPMLYQQSGGGEEDRSAMPTKVAKPGKPDDGADSKDPPKINPGVWRKLLLLAQNPKNAKMLRLDEWWESRGEDAPPPTPEQLAMAAAIVDDPYNQASEVTMGDELTPAEGANAAKLPPAKRRRKRPTKPAAMGAEETSAMIDKFRDGGMMEIFRTTVRDDTIPPPEDRLSMLKFLIADSPMYAHSLILAIANKRAPPETPNCTLPNRLVIMVDTPWAQQEATILYNLLGWRVYNIRSSQNADERQYIIDMFNSPEADIDVLITNPRLSSAGVDMHKACRRGQIWTLTWNANNIQQMRGRLVRLGQQRSVTWDILMVGNTLFERLGLLVDRKYTRQMAAESKVHIEGHWGIGVMYELQAMIFGYPFSRWVIEILEPGVGAYGNPAIIAVANATSELLRFALSNDVVAKFLSKKDPVEIIGAGARLLELRAQGPVELDAEFVTENTSYTQWGEDHQAPKLEDMEAEENFRDAIERIEERSMAPARVRRTGRRTNPSATKQTQEAAEELAKPVKSTTANLFKTKGKKVYKSAELAIDSNESEAMAIDGSSWDDDNDTQAMDESPSRKP